MEDKYDKSLMRKYDTKQSKRNPQHKEDFIQIDFDTFLRSFKQNLDSSFAFLLGAGTSVSSGIQSAAGCIREWKWLIYKSSNREALNNPTDEDIQLWLDQQEGFPKEGSVDEYSFYVEKAYPIESDRTKYFEALCSNKVPSIGYIFLALLNKYGILKSVWTTNFDGLTERTAHQINITPISVNLDNPERIFRSESQNELLYVALHGDYKYSKLKNTGKELDCQNRTFERRLKEYLVDKNLVVIGYSGRDKSIMNALSKVYKKKGGGGLYWCGYKEGTPNQEVVSLLKIAQKSGRKAVYVPTLGFDDFMVSLMTFCFADVPEKKIEIQQYIKNREQNAPNRIGRQGPIFSIHPQNNIKYIQNASFTGREKILKTLERNFISQNTNNNSYYVQIICGEAGVGKSEIAKQFTFIHWNDYEYIWWIDAEQESTIIAAYSDFAYKHNLVKGDDYTNAEMIIESVRHWQESNISEKWLFVYDNVGEESKIKNYLPRKNPLNQRQNILITTRYSQLSSSRYMSGAPKIQVDVFTEQESLSLIEKRTGKSRDNYASQLVKELGFLAIAIEHAAAYMKVHDMSYQKYLKLLKKSDIELLKHRYEIDNSLKPVASIWDISMKQLSEESYRLLQIISYFAPTDIHEEWFMKENEIELNDKIADLLKYSLIKQSSKNKGGQRVISIHRLLQKVLLDKNKGNVEILAECKRIISNQIFKDFDSVDYKQKFYELSPHIESILSNDDIIHDFNRYRLCKFLAEGFLAVSKYNNSLTYCEEALISLPNEYMDSLEHAYLLNLFGRNYMYKGEYENSLKNLNEAKHICDNYLNLNDINKQNISDNQKKDLGKDNILIIAKIYSDFGLTRIYENEPDALQYLVSSYNLLKDIMHPYTADVYNNMGEAYRRKGQLDEALDYHKKSLCLRIQLRGKNHYETVNSINNLAIVYRDKGVKENDKELIKKALKLFQNAQKVYKEQLGKNHFYWAVATHNIGNTYKILEDYKRALRNLSLALNLYNQKCSKDHPYIKYAEKSIKEIKELLRVR